MFSIENKGGKLSYIVVLSFFCISYFLAAVGSKSAEIYVLSSFVVSVSILWLSSRGDKPYYTKMYIYFLLSVWLTSPFLRRINDFGSGWSDLNVYALAPLICTLVSLFFVNYAALKLQRFTLLWFLIFASLIYSLFIGVLLNGVAASFYDFLNWSAPVVILLFIASNYRSYHYLTSGMANYITFFVFVLALYGVYQYYYLPNWDSFWIANAPMTSVGIALPMQFRVFSTLNSPMVFAPILSILFVIAMSSKSNLKQIALLFALLTLVLTFVRAAWLGLILMIFIKIILDSKSNPFSVIKFSLAAFLASLSFGYFLLGTEAGEMFYRRLETILYVEDDVSYNARMEFFNSMLGYALTNFFGDGFGSIGRSAVLAQGMNIDTVFDNGFLELFVVLGWVGTLLYLYPVFYFLKICYYTCRYRYDEISTFSAIAFVVSFIQMIFSNRFVGPIGFFAFFALGIAVSSFYFRLSIRKEYS